MEFFNSKTSIDCRYRKCSGHCQCKRKVCVSCKHGFYDINNACNSVCPDNCATCSSSTNCSSCKDGYYNGYQSDDSSLPLLNDCTYKCRDTCVQCSRYGLCSVCKTGYYGSICEKNCSTGCLSNSCDIQTGNCECAPNFYGDTCDTCINGKYGAMCDKKCSSGCKGNACKKDSGDCIDGCIVNTITGAKCDVCSTGWYRPCILYFLSFLLADE